LAPPPRKAKVRTAPASKKKPKRAKRVTSVEKPKRIAKAKPTEKEVHAQAPVKETPRLGPPPMPTVESRHLESLHERQARGFSFGELASAGVPVAAAKREELSIDIRRRSVLEENVGKLKVWFRRAGNGGDEGKKEAPPAQAPAKKR